MSPKDGGVRLSGILRRVFGISELRPGQRAVIDSVVAGRHTLAIMPTGAGKSLCYQVPALIKPGMTLVVSPLIALMRDQLEKLQALGLPAVQINSAVPAGDIQRARARIGRRSVEFIFITPEQLSDPDRLGQWYRGRYAVCRTSGTQGVPALIVQDRAAMELLFGLQMMRGSVLSRGPGAALVRLLRPARLAAVTIGKTPAAALFTHTLVVLEENAEAFVVDAFHSETQEQQAMTSCVVELILDKSAKLRYVQVQDWGRHVWNFMTERAVLQKDATVNSLHVTLGSKWTKNSIGSHLKGENTLEATVVQCPPVFFRKACPDITPTISHTV